MATHLHLYSRAVDSEHAQRSFAEFNIPIIASKVNRGFRMTNGDMHLWALSTGDTDWLHGMELTSVVVSEVFNRDDARLLEIIHPRLR